MAILLTKNSHMTLSLGRPRAIHLDDCNVRDPIDCDYPLDRTKRYPPAPSSFGRPSSFTPHWFQHEVGKMIHEVLSSGIHTAEANNHITALQYHRRIGSMIQQLPKSINPVHPDRSLDLSVAHLPIMRIQVEVTANAFLLAIHRRHSRAQSRNRELAIDAALKLLSAQHRLFCAMDRVPHTIFMLSYYSVDASLYLAAVLAGPSRDDPHLAEQIQLALNQTAERLSWMANRSAVAASGLAAIKRICPTQLLARIQDESSPQATTMPARNEPDHGQDAMPPGPPQTHESHIVDPDPLVDIDIWGPRSSDPTISTANAKDQEWPPSDAVDLFDPFMGVTDPEYTVESFLSELL